MSEHFVRAQRGGKTQAMIVEACEAVREGEPSILIYGHSTRFCTQTLRPRIIVELEERGLSIKHVTADRIHVEDSTIVLTTPSSIEEGRRFGLRKFVELWDHSVFELDTSLEGTKWQASTK